MDESERIEYLRRKKQEEEERKNKEEERKRTEEEAALQAAEEARLQAELLARYCLISSGLCNSSWLDLTHFWCHWIYKNG